jgi:hypothetical protein
MIKEHYLAQGMTQADAEQRAQEVDDIIAAHNEKIKYIARERQRGVRFTQLPSGREGSLQLATRLVNHMLENSDISNEAGEQLTNIMMRLANASSPEEFDREWKELRQLMESDPTLRPAIPAICESIEMLRKATAGGTILIPITPSFKTADVVVLDAPLTGFDADNIEEVAENIKIVYSQVDLRSVKSLKGGASVIQQKIELTIFDSEERKQDLLSLCSTNSHRELWQVSTAEEMTAYVKKQLELVRKYLPDIIAYYNLPEGTTLEEVFEIFKQGVPPRYDRDGNYLGAGNQSEVFKKPITDLNKQQLHLYSFIGFVSDAIYNRGARGQGFTNTTFKESEIVETNGSSVLARSVFQFNKNLHIRSDGVLRDDGFQSKIEAAQSEDMGRFR